MMEKFANLQLGQLVAYIAVIVALLSTCLEVSKIKINPWSWLARTIGRAINGEVLEKVNETKRELDQHIRVDDERNADLHRARILQFDRELLHDNEIRHTEEDFNEILYNIDCYEHYCVSHPDYQNNRAIHAIRNIKRVYDSCMENHGFLQLP